MTFAAALSAIPEVVRAIDGDVLRRIDAPEDYLGAAELFRVRLLDEAADDAIAGSHGSRSHMPLVKIGNNTCYYRLDGHADRPVLIFSHSLGLDHGMWDAQAADLLPYFRILRYDTRGHGASSAPAGDYAIADLGRDVLALADSCGVTRFAFCGLSLGGMIGQWLAAHTPERVTQLVLANTTAKLSDPQPMEARRRAVLDAGMGAIEALVMGRFFSASVLDSPSPQVESARRTLLRRAPLVTLDAVPRSATWITRLSWRRFTLRRSSSAATLTSACRGIIMPRS